MQEFMPGDLIEIRLEGRISYVLVTHDHPSYPTVVQGLTGHHDKRPSDTGSLTKTKPAFTVMLPLGSVLSTLNIDHEVVENVDLSDMTFPTFRMPIRDKQGEVVYWWYWDGRGLSYELDPGEEHNAMPLREITSAERFIDLLRQASA
ncbi:hypothetical protein [Loktanella sp. M215]|uniref:hypothetical protein n=1 Tax=Loktanella sp. M215 TaxID=2675431 RepID=UPI001F42512F|nr:hypothetical protein [Loktanella sp. M215]MBU2357876.1 hypothetical protein [Alphaproteobacteria bacterium]MCF7702071.1 hypothetical protein [Loktanella sp. M215]